MTKSFKEFADTRDITEGLEESATRFIQKVNQAANAAASGNHKNATMHLDNARSFMFGVKSTDMGKIKDAHDTYKNLRTKYSGSGGNYTPKDNMIGVAKIHEGFGEDDIALGGTVIYKHGSGHAMSKAVSKNMRHVKTQSGHEVPLHHIVSTDSSDWKHYKSVNEVVTEGHYEDGEGHQAKAIAADAKGDRVAYHSHMADHHDSMVQWHESKGRYAAADKHAKEVEHHHEKATKLAMGVDESVDLQVEARHIVNVTISEPDHTMVTKRKETIQKRASIAANNKEEAISGAIAHYKRQGYKVHDHYYVGHDGEGVTENANSNTTSQKVVFSGTGANGSKYKIIQSSPYDFMIHVNGKHLDTYSSLQRAMSVLKNEVSGLVKVVEGWDKLTPQQKAHEYNLDAAQKEMDHRHAQGEDMTGAKIDKKTYKIVKPKQQGVAEGSSRDDMVGLKEEGIAEAHMKGKQKPYVSSVGGRGNYEVLGNLGQVKATFTRKEHGTDARVKAITHLHKNYDAYMKEDVDTDHMKEAKLTESDEIQTSDYKLSSSGRKVRTKHIIFHNQDDDEKDDDENKKDKDMKEQAPVAPHLPKQTNEEMEPTMKSYKEFIQAINEVKLSDLPSRQVRGHSYGAQYHDPEGDDDADDKPKTKPAPTEKRGRGRPKGTLSGARQIGHSAVKKSGVEYTGYHLHLPGNK